MSPPHPSRRSRATAQRAFAAGLIVVAVIGTAPPAGAYPPPGRTERVSVATGGDEVGHGGLPAATCCSVISGDGLHVAFMSGHDGFVPDDGNFTLDVFVHHRAEGVTERVSVASDGSEGAGESYSPAISADGRFVAFESNATTLVPGDENFSNDIFVRDLVAGTTERASLAPGGAESTGYASYPDISADGRYVAFQSTAADLVPGDTNGLQDVFVHDRATGATVRASVATGGAEATGGASVDASISPDGRFVAFESTATNLVPGDTNGAMDVFVHDLVSGTTERVSIATGGAEANERSLDAAINGDGSVVAFHSAAHNLVPGDANASTDVFVRDREAQTTERVSVTGAGGEDPGTSVDPAISADGRYVAFWNVTDLVPADAGLSVPFNPATVNIFVRDRVGRTTEQVSVGTGGAQPDSYSYDPTLSADGAQVAFYSFSSNLIEEDGNAVADVFVRERGPSLGIGDLDVEKASDQVSVSGWARFASTTLSTAADPAGDAGANGASVGGELVGASVTQRPEDEDLLVELDLAALPSPPLGGAPAVLYGMSFEAGATRYEVRALRAAAATAPPAAPYFGLYRCAATCSEVARLAGGIGATGTRVSMAVPLGHLGGAAGLSGIRAFTAAGEAAAGAVHLFDEVSLPSASLEAPRVDVGVAPAARPADEVSFGAVNAPAGGIFSSAVDVTSLPAGQYRIWARACIAETCGPPRSVVTTLP